MTAILLTLLIVAGVVTLVLGLTITARLLSARSADRLARYLAEVEDHLFAFAVEARDDPPPPPRDRSQRRMMRDRLVELAPSLRGDSRDRLSSMFGLYGLVELTRSELGSPDPITCVRAVEALAAMGVQESVPWLEDLLSTGDPLLVLASGRGLAALGAIVTLPEVLTALVDVGAEPGEVSEILLAFGAAGVPFLCERVQDGAAAERRLSAATLGEIRALAGAHALRGAMRDPDHEVAAAAVRALGQIGAGFTVSDMVAMLGADRRPWFVRVATASALAALDDPAAAAALAGALHEEEWDVRAAVARALVALGPAGLTAVCDALPELEDGAVAHVAGTLDVEERLEDAIVRAAAGDIALDRFVRRAARAGVRARLRELARVDSPAGPYADSVLTGALESDRRAAAGRSEVAA